MEFELAAIPSGEAYRLLTGVVVPRPIAWVTSIGENGVVNAAPFSYFNLLGSDPAIVGIGVGNRRDGEPKDTARNSIRTGEFVVNLVDETNAAQMNITAIEFPAGISEATEAGLTLIPSAAVQTPRLREAPVHLECRLVDQITIGRNHILLGEVVHIQVRDEFLDENRLPRTDALRLIGRMHGGGWYARTTDLFEMPRLRRDEVPRLRRDEVPRIDG